MAKGSKARPAASARSRLKGSKLKKSTRGGTLTKTKHSDVAVRTSTLQGAGKGLFAVREFAKGTLLPAPYLGRRLTLEQFSKLRDFRWCFQIEDGDCWAVDGKALKQANPCRWVNGARTAAQRRRVNIAGIKLEDGQAWFVTTRAVRADEEFLIDYGPGYWQAYEDCWGRPARLRARLRAARAALQGSASQAKARGSRRRELEDEIEELQDELEDVGWD